MSRGAPEGRAEGHRGDYEALVAMGEARSYEAFKALGKERSTGAQAEFERACRRKEREAARADARRVRMDRRTRVFRTYRRKSGAALAAAGEE